MIEERIDKLVWEIHTKADAKRILLAVAAEAREEGIDEMQDATCFCEKCLIPGHQPLCAVCEAAERLKEKGK